MVVATQRTSERPRTPRARERPAGLVAALVVALGVALHLPSLGMGFYADDYVQQIALREPDAYPALPRWNLFDFGTYETWQAVQAESGGLPWWTSEGWKVRFFRPLASLTTWIDHALHGSAPLGYHATSLALYAVLLVVLLALYRALGLGRGAAAGALAIFALCDASVLPVGWIANRNAVLAAIFTAAAVLAARSVARLGAGRAAALGLAAALLASLSKESGVVAFALCAIELARARRDAADARARARLAAGAALALGAAVAFPLALAAAGYGTRSVFYVTPWSEPLRFAGSLARLAAFAPAALAGPLPLDALVASGADVRVLAAACALPSALLAWWVGRRAAGHAAAPTLAAMLVLCLAPEAAAPASDRLLFAASMASSALFAIFFQRVRARGRAERIAAAALALSLTLGSGGYLLLQSAGMASIARGIREASITADVGAPELGRRDVLVLQPPSALYGFALPATWMAETSDRALAIWPLQIARRGVRWTRVDERTFDVESTGEPFLRGMFELVYLAREPVLAPGTRWRTPVGEIEAVEVEEGALRRIRVRLERSADDPTLRFLVAREGRYVHQPPPAVGETIEIAPAPPPQPFLP